MPIRSASSAEICSPSSSSSVHFFRGTLRSIISRRLEGGDQLAQELVGEGVAGVWLVERDGGDGVPDVVAESRVGHGRQPTAPRVGSRKSYCLLCHRGPVRFKT